jgi:hypothetical protein
LKLFNSLIYFTYVGGRKYVQMAESCQGINVVMN